MGLKVQGQPTIGDQGQPGQLTEIMSKNKEQKKLKTARSAVAMGEWDNQLLHCCLFLLQTVLHLKPSR